MKLDVLAIGAHPDDVELACAGTVIKLVDLGRKVGILDLTRGELGTRGNQEIREAEAMKATQILGVQVRENLNLKDGNIEINQENKLQLIQFIRRYRPDILLIPHWLERHPDHEHTHQLSREAWFFSGLSKLETRFQGELQEPFRPRSYFHFMQSYEFVPSFVVDISNEYERRMDSVRAFKSQFFDPTNTERETFLSSPEFMERLRTRFEYFGSRIGRKYGEPFFSINMVGVNDPFTLIL